LSCSIELWLRFLAYSIKTLWVRRSPLAVLDEEVLARQLYSGHVRKNGRLNPSAFIASARNGFGLSVDRWCKAPERLFLANALLAARRRQGGQKFKGFARFDAASLKSIELGDSLHPRAIGAPTLRNPFHADIPLPPDKEEDYYLLIATEFINKANPQAVLY